MMGIAHRIDNDEDASIDFTGVDTYDEMSHWLLANKFNTSSAFLAGVF
jgi:hypothetical protein